MLNDVGENLAGLLSAGLITISVTINRDSSMDIKILPNVTPDKGVEAQMGIDYGECTKSEKDRHILRNLEKSFTDFDKAMAESRQNFARATQRFMTEINGGDEAKEDIHAD